MSGYKSISKESKIKKIIITAIVFIAFIQSVLAQNNADTARKTIWTNHFQFTTVVQSHTGFKSLYSSKNSLSDSVEIASITATATLFLGHKLWKGAALYFNPELSGGRD